MNPFDAGWARRSKPQSARRPGQDAPAQPEASALQAREEAASEACFTPCHILAPDVVAYFDGEADASASLRARRHLDACPECARMWRDWGDARLLMRTQRVPEMPSHWPASLVQRARLHALLPTLFPRVESSALPIEDAPRTSFEAPIAPYGLQDAILSRTTRAALRHGGTEHAPQPPLPALKKARLDGPSRRKLVARACVPALAAWMIVMASAPSAPPPTQQGAHAGVATQPAPSVVVARVASAQPRQNEGLAHPSPAEPLELMGAVLRESFVLPAEAPVGMEAPSAKPSPRAEAAERRATGRRPVAEGEEASPEHARVLEPAPKPRESEAVSHAVPLSTSEAAPRAGDRLAFSEARPSTVSRVDEPKEGPARVGAGTVPPAEHESLGVVLALNDTRPAEIGDAIDAYASTWLDEGDASP